MTVSSVKGHCKLGDAKNDMSNDRLLSLSMRAPITGDGVVPAEVASLDDRQLGQRALQTW